MKKIIFAGVLLLLTCFIFYSCSKQDNIKDQNDSQNELKNLFKNKPLSQIQILNLDGKGFYSDLKGAKIEYKSVMQNGRTTGTSCPDPGDSEFSQTFISMEREFTCNIGYRFVVNYKIISEFYLLNSIRSSNFSGGRIRLKILPVFIIISLHPQIEHR